MDRIGNVQSGNVQSGNVPSSNVPNSNVPNDAARATSWQLLLPSRLAAQFGAQRYDGGTFP